MRLSRALPPPYHSKASTWRLEWYAEGAPRSVSPSKQVSEPVHSPAAASARRQALLASVVLLLLASACVSPGPGPAAHPACECENQLAPAQSLNAQDPSLPIELQRVVDEGSVAERRAAAERLVTLARLVGDPAWLDEQRPRLMAANEAAHLAPTADQLEAQLTRLQLETLASIHRAMSGLEEASVREYALAEAESPELSPARRQAALDVLRASAPVDDTELRERCDVLAKEIGAALEAQKQQRPTTLFASAMASLRDQLRDCYRELLAQDEQAEVRSQMMVRVDAAGQPQAIAFDPEIPTSLSSCVSNVVQARTFPSSKGGTVLKVPLYFVQRQQ